jgi:enoyl-CoA hydratase/carnithine racemase
LTPTVRRDPRWRCPSRSSARSRRCRISTPSCARSRFTNHWPPTPATEGDKDLNVIVFDSANADFYLAHYDAKDDPGRHAWLDLLARLSRAPVVSIASIRGRARGAGTEFVLACDLRFASREHTLLGHPEVGAGDAATARLACLVGRGRALEILLVADDLDGPRAERYGYVNRVIADDRLADEVEDIASRLARFDHEALARTKSYVDRVTLTRR